MLKVLVKVAVLSFRMLNFRIFVENTTVTSGDLMERFPNDRYLLKNNFYSIIFNLLNFHALLGLGQSQNK